MTENEKRQITDLRHAGKTMLEIADLLDLTLSTVKTFCTRNKIVSTVYTHCLTCGKELSQGAGYKRRKFCCKRCKDDWWNHNPHRRNKCPVCGRPTSGKYCSSKCYREDRYGRD